MYLHALYTPTPPPHLLALAHTPAMERLRQVGMNCGCEYTAFPRFAQCGSYSRWVHSLGVGLIVWHFTQDIAQAIAGLLHDIATPVFAHTIDFLLGDYMKQETTEAKTADFIAASPEIQCILRQLDLTTEAVADYHRYPLADNESPKLSADRLEYTCGNLLYYGFASREKIGSLYADIVPGLNEAGQDELVFRTPKVALAFARGALQCARVYVCDEDRFAMESLARMLREALALGAITTTDLWQTEDALIRKLVAHPTTRDAWCRYRRYRRVISCREKPETGLWLQVPAKKRSIDPYVLEQGRVSRLFPEFARELEAFREAPLDNWLSGEMESRGGLSSCV